MAINCAAIPRELVESELFGYEKGAHSTAQGRKVGLVELAHGGTLFLDEIGDMPVELQSKLLRFLQDRRFTPLGGTRVVEADVRIIAATSRTALAKGHTSRRRCWAAWARSRSCCRRCATASKTSAAWPPTSWATARRARSSRRPSTRMCLHAWPLNVRELSKVINEAKALSLGVPAIGLEHLPDAVTATLQLDAEEDVEDTHVDPHPAARVRRSRA